MPTARSAHQWAEAGHPTIPGREGGWPGWGSRGPPIRMVSGVPVLPVRVRPGRLHRAPIGWEEPPPLTERQAIDLVHNPALRG